MDSAPSHDVDPPFSSAGHVALERWETVQVAGRDRATFLHNMCTNDIRALADGSGCEAFFTDVKGKIIAHTYILATADELLLIAVPGVAERLIPHLDRYVIREDVQLADRTTDYAWTLLAGRASAVALEVAAADPRTLSGPWSHVQTEVGGVRIRAVRCDLPWPGGYLAACTPDMCQQFRRILSEIGVPLCSEADWHALRIESGWPLQGVDFDDSNFPQEVGRDPQAISFRKGCYLVQETIARIDALGHVNKRLATIRIDGGLSPILIGSELRADGDPAGRVTSSAWSPTLNSMIGLAMVKRGFNEPGRRLTAADISAEVVPTPACSPALKESS
jgi:folate-binding protein YgfZ